MHPLFPCGSTWCYDVRRHDASGSETKKREELPAPSRQRMAACMVRYGEIPPCHPILTFQILGDAETVVAVVAVIAREKLSCSVGFFNLIPY